MKLFVPCPGLGKHGGIRIIIELANRLAEFHDVFFYSLQGYEGKDYWKFHPNIQFLDKKNIHHRLREMDCLFITSPHSAYLSTLPRGPKKVFMHLQMMEHMFNKTNRHWLGECKLMYKSPYPLFSISKWNIEMLKTEFRRSGETIYIGNGLNLEDFPIKKNCRKDDKMVLVEGWESHNECKDTEQVAHKTALKLKEDGFKIVSYGILPLVSNPELVDEYHLWPTIDRINTLYEKAKILVKASKYDARACAPVEALTKGTPTARAIIKGDDDLIDGYNSLRSDYEEGHEKLYENAKKLLTNDSLYGIIQENCYKYLEEGNCSWDKWITVIRSRIEN